MLFGSNISRVVERFVIAPTLVRKLAAYDELPRKKRGALVDSLKRRLSHARRERDEEMAKEVEWTFGLLKALDTGSPATISSSLRDGETQKIFLSRRNTGRIIGEMVEGGTAQIKYYRAQQLVEASAQLLQRLDVDLKASETPNLNPNGTPTYLIGYSHINPEGPLPVVEDSAEELVRRGLEPEAVVLLIVGAVELSDRTPEAAARMAARAGEIAVNSLGPRDAALVLTTGSTVHFKCGDNARAYTAASQAIDILKPYERSSADRPDPELQHLVGDAYTARARAGQELGEDVEEDFTQALSRLRKLALTATEDTHASHLVSCGMGYANRGGYRSSVGRNWEAVSDLSRAQRLMQLVPNDADSRVVLALAMTQKMLGRVKMQTGGFDLESGYKNAQDAVSSLTRAVLRAARYGPYELRVHLSSALGDCASYAEGLGLAREARRFGRRQYRILSGIEKRLGEAFPPPWAHSLAMSLLREIGHTDNVKAAMSMGDRAARSVQICIDAAHGLSVIMYRRLSAWVQICTARALPKTDEGDGLAAIAASTAQGSLAKCAKAVGGLLRDQYLAEEAAAFAEMGTRLHRMGDKWGKPGQSREHAAYCFERALALLAQPNIRRHSDLPHSEVALSAAINLAALGRFGMADEVVQTGLKIRRDDLDNTATLAGQLHFATAGHRLGAFGATLKVRLGDLQGAIETLDRGQNLLLKASYLSDPALLRSTIGPALAGQLSDTLKTLERRRAQVAESGQSDPGSPVSDRLGIALKVAQTHVNMVLGSVGDKLPRFDVRALDLIAAVPDGGIIAIPVVAEMGGTAICIRKGGGDDAFFTADLPRLTRAQVETWRRTDAEMRKLSVARPGEGPARRLHYERLLTESSESYWDVLVGPIADLMSQKGFDANAPLTLISQGEFSSLPLHIASRVRDGRRRFAIEDRVVRYAPGASALVKLASSEPGTVRRTIGFIDPEGHLPSAGIEWERIASLAWAETFARGRGALAADVADELTSYAERGGAVYLHMAAHGWYDEKNPLRSGLVFGKAPKGPFDILSVASILAIGRVPNLQFVGLASCHSGYASERVAPEEFIGLASAFIQIGARSLLTALHAIDDRTAADFVPALYKRMLDGRDIAEAFRDEIIDRISGNSPSWPAPSDTTPGDKMSRYPVPPDELIASGGGSEPWPFSISDWAAFKPTCA